MDSLSRATSLKKMTLPSPSNHCHMANSFWARGGSSCSPPHQCLNFTRFDLVGSCACSHRSYEFMCATSLSCSENIVLQESPKYLYSLQYFWSPFILFLSLTPKWGVWYICVTWVKCSTVFYSLYFAKSWIYILLAIHGKISFPLGTCTSQWLYR